MSKKQKRRISTAEPVHEVIQKPATPTGRYTSTGEFNPDYSPIIKDLKRIGILAGTFFVILIALSFFLR